MENNKCFGLAKNLKNKCDILNNKSGERQVCKGDGFYKEDGELKKCSFYKTSAEYKAGIKNKNTRMGEGVKKK